MSDTPTRFPLVWPAGRPRTESWKRQHGKYTSDGKPITTSVAMDRLDGEVHRLGGSGALLSTNVDTTLSGRPRSGAATPSDPGVCLYFTLKGKPYVMACDTFSRVEQNIAALAAHIEATRRIARLGVATADEALQSFQALPAPDHILPATQKWWEVFGIMREAATPDTIQALYRTLAKRRVHDENLMRELNVARDEALKELS